MPARKALVSSGPAKVSSGGRLTSNVVASSTDSSPGKNGSPLLSLESGRVAPAPPVVVNEALALSAVLFTIGVVGVLTRRNAIIIFMCVELMLNAVNLSFVAFSRLYGVTGQVFVVFVMTVAAAEAAVGLAIIISIFRHRQSVDLKNVNLLKG